MSNLKFISRPNFSQARLSLLLYQVHFLSLVIYWSLRGILYFHLRLPANQSNLLLLSYPSYIKLTLPIYSSITCLSKHRALQKLIFSVSSKETTIIVNNIYKQIFRNRPMSKPNGDDEIITINVGGRHFTTFKVPHFVLRNHYVIYF